MFLLRENEMIRVKHLLIALVLLLLFLNIFMESSAQEPSPASADQLVTVSTVNEDNFKAEVIKSKLPVLVDFFATWCGPCRMYSGVVDQVAQEYKGRLKVVRVDVDKSPKLYGATRSQAVPTSYLFKKGKAVDKWEGALSKEELEGELRRVLALKLPVK
jgi:thioredoxin 1